MTHGKATAKNFAYSSGKPIAWRSTIARFVHENPVFVIALLISLLLPFFWLLLWKLPQWQVAAVPEMKDRIDLGSKSRQTLAQILGGAALLIGLYFTSQTLRTTQEGQITDRFTKAITQLGNTNLAIRLGGIYALEPTFKGVWPAAANFVLLPLLDTSPGQYPPRHR